MIDVSSCIHCGLCKESCLFLEKYEMDLAAFSKQPDLAYHCFLCGRCDEVCPMDISGRGIALEHRRNTVRSGGGQLPDHSYDGLVLEKSPYKFANYRHAKCEKKSVLFTGCNFPSFYPKTTDYLVDLLKSYGVGVVYDCCGKPIGELGLEKEEKECIDRINHQLLSAGVEEVVMLCPNCYYFLEGKLQAKIVSVYEKMRELGIGDKLSMERIPVYYPCPDRATKKFFKDLSFFLNEDAEIANSFEELLCCGLGGCAAGKESDLVEKIAATVKNSEEKELYTYCASCISSFRRRGYESAKHLLPMILGKDEKVPLGKTPILNRAKCKLK